MVNSSEYRSDTKPVDMSSNGCPLKNCGTTSISDLLLMPYKINSVNKKPIAPPRANKATCRGV